jgi:hypothetical protein
MCGCGARRSRDSRQGSQEHQLARLQLECVAAAVGAIGTTAPMAIAGLRTRQDVNPVTSLDCCWQGLY